MGLFERDRDLNVPPDRVELRVSASALGQKVEDVNLRLDAFLGRHLKWRSRTSIAYVRAAMGWPWIFSLIWPNRSRGNSGAL